MIISDTQVYNLEGAVRGVRNPLASWDKSDSRYYDEIGNVFDTEKALKRRTSRL